MIQNYTVENGKLVGWFAYRPFSLDDTPENRKAIDRQFQAVRDEIDQEIIKYIEKSVKLYGL